MTDLFHFSKLWRTKDTCWTKKDVLSKAYNEMIVMSEAAVARLVIFEKSQLIDELDAAKQLVTERTFKALFGFKISDPTLQSFLELIKMVYTNILGQARSGKSMLPYDKKQDFYWMYCGDTWINFYTSDQITTKAKGKQPLTDIAKGKCKHGCWYGRDSERYSPPNFNPDGTAIVAPLCGPNIIATSSRNQAAMTLCPAVFNGNYLESISDIQSNPEKYINENTPIGEMKSLAQVLLREMIKLQITAFTGGIDNQPAYDFQGHQIPGKTASNGWPDCVKLAKSKSGYTKAYLNSETLTLFPVAMVFGDLDLSTGKARSLSMKEVYSILHDYSASDDELTVQKNELVELVAQIKTGGGWSDVKKLKDGSTAWIPTRFLGPSQPARRSVPLVAGRALSSVVSPGPTTGVLGALPAPSGSVFVASNTTKTSDIVSDLLENPSSEDEDEVAAFLVKMFETEIPEVSSVVQNSSELSALLQILSPAYSNSSTNSSRLATNLLSSFNATSLSLVKTCQSQCVESIQKNCCTASESSCSEIGTCLDASVVKDDVCGTSLGLSCERGCIFLEGRILKSGRTTKQAVDCLSALE